MSTVWLTFGVQNHMMRKQINKNHTNVFIYLLERIFSISLFQYLFIITGNFIWYILKNRYINPTENKYVAFVTLGEGWHNYHHVFPWDYKAAELGNYTLNISTMFIDFWAKIGWAYDLKQPSEELIRNVVMKRSDRNRSLQQSISRPGSKN